MAQTNLSQPGLGDEGHQGTIPERIELPSDYDPDELDVDDPEDVKTKLLTALSKVGENSAFAGYGDLPNMPYPALIVKDVGFVDLPLSESRARDLIQKSHQAPFGKGSDTVIDTDVRRTWEINADQLEFREPTTWWDQNIRDLEKRVGEELGMTANVKAELYKLLIYEEGAMFKPHTE